MVIELKNKEDKTVCMVYMSNQEIANNLNPSQEEIDEYNSAYSAWCD